MIPFVVLSPRGEERVAGGHPWVYRADIRTVSAEAGDRVIVESARGRVLGHAFYSDRSLIAIRMLATGALAGDPADDALIRRRIESAIAFRRSLAINATACRLVHGEAD